MSLTYHTSPSTVHEEEEFAPLVFASEEEEFEHYARCMEQQFGDDSPFLTVEEIRHVQRLAEMPAGTPHSAESKRILRKLEVASAMLRGDLPIMPESEFLEYERQWHEAHEVIVVPKIIKRRKQRHKKKTSGMMDIGAIFFLLERLDRQAALAKFVIVRFSWSKAVSRTGSVSAAEVLGLASAPVSPGQLHSGLSPPTTPRPPRRA